MSDPELQLEKQRADLKGWVSHYNHGWVHMSLGPGIPAPLRPPPPQNLHRRRLPDGYLLFAGPWGIVNDDPTGRCDSLQSMKALEDIEDEIAFHLDIKPSKWPPPTRDPGSLRGFIPSLILIGSFDPDHDGRDYGRHVPKEQYSRRAFDLLAKLDPSWDASAEAAIAIPRLLYLVKHGAGWSSRSAALMLGRIGDGHTISHSCPRQQTV
jgi:hypothetical protein